MLAGNFNIKLTKISKRSNNPANVLTLKKEVQCRSCSVTKLHWLSCCSVGGLNTPAHSFDLERGDCAPYSVTTPESLVSMQEGKKYIYLPHCYFEIELVLNDLEDHNKLITKILSPPGFAAQIYQQVSIGSWSSVHGQEPGSLPRFYFLRPVSVDTLSVGQR